MRETGGICELREILRGGISSRVRISRRFSRRRGARDRAGRPVSAVTNRVRVPQSPELFAYDANGNRTVVETPAGRWAVEWNAENRPVRWTCGNRTLLMAYDHMGRRVRYVEIVGGETNRTVSFLYDGYLCIARTADGVTDRFLWDPTEPVATRPLATVADGTPYLYAHDANKNVSELVDARTGETAAHYDYSSFGRTLIAAGPLARRNPFRFSSEYADDATGLSYYNWRHYDPVHGRWLSEDPIGEEGGLNLYAMCQNDLQINTDIIGNSSFWSCFGKCLAYQTARVEETLATLSALAGTLEGLMELPMGTKGFNLGTEKITSLGNRIYQMLGSNNLPAPLKGLLKPIGNWARTSGSFDILPIRSGNQYVRRMAKWTRTGIRVIRGAMTTLAASAVLLESYCASQCLSCEKREYYEGIFESNPEYFIPTFIRKTL